MLFILTNEVVKSKYETNANCAETARVTRLNHVKKRKKLEKIYTTFS